MWGSNLWACSSSGHLRRKFDQYAATDWDEQMLFATYRSTVSD
jgi:hypothetical protein